MDGKGCIVQEEMDTLVGDQRSSCFDLERTNVADRKDVVMAGDVCRQ